ncbi:MAG: L-serine ammonia-lyase, iron-sulfur-dependent subunit beta [Candidatus Gastranaerophilales bacterium]|nr:L-serine ammonia-lyase, iron-sulfur-dependent subunit beta [Candidatus Gastranaerophilales bacterium]
MQNKKTVLDILGPVMVGPSSSHTAGALRLGLLAGRIFGSGLKNVEFHLYNSFAKTGKGHGTQNALIAGLLGLNTDDEKIKSSPLLAMERGLEYNFSYFDDYNRHPNSVDFIMSDKNGLKITVKGSSIGAGEVVIEEINGYSFNLRGDYPTLLLMYKDTPGMIYRVANLIQSRSINIASMICDRAQKGAGASMGICLDSSLSDEVYEQIEKIEDIYMIRLIGKLNE